MNTQSIDYKDSGVDIEEGYKAVSKYKQFAKRTMIPGVINDLGSFAGMFEVPADVKNPVLVSGTDGVGTKLDVAFAIKKYDTVGIDCVAMSVNDILCTGARPLYFLDYIACGKLDSDIASDIVKGVSEGCLQSGCALLGGETAEMPGFYDEGKYDIAGFGVGIIDKTKVINGETIKAGDRLIGLASSGVHSNGFSLIRKLVQDFDTPFNGNAENKTDKKNDNKTDSTIGEVLLTPTKIYVKPVLEVLTQFPNAVRGMVHVTGGGFYENIPRMFPKNSGGAFLHRAVIKKNSWKVLPIFDELVRRGAKADRMFHTFNMGIGFILAVDESKAGKIVQAFNALGETAYDIGSMEALDKPAVLSQEEAVVFKD